MRDGGSGGSGGHRVLIGAIVSAVLVIGAVAGGLSLVFTGVVTLPGFGGELSGSGSAQSGNAPSPTPTPTRPPAEPVLEGVGTSSELPTKAGLAKALSNVLDDPALGGHVGVAVREVATGELLYGSDGGSAFIPASTTKIVSGAAALAALGPEHRFETSVVQGDDPSEIVLVGGGDPLLATAKAWSRRADAVHDRLYPEPATIDDLAARTAEALLAEGTKRVTVRYDDSLFTEAESAKWEAQYVGSVVSPITALWVDEGRSNWPYDLPRAADPSKTAAEAFVRALGKQGVKVRGEPSRQAAPVSAPSSAELAAVSSPPLSEIVEHVLLLSDNDGAEVLARHVAVAQGKPATFDGAVAGMAEVLAQYGIAAEEFDSLYDGSGLSRHNQLTPNLLTSVLAAAADPSYPELRSVLTGLPVAAFNGSLGDRFTLDGSAESGRGVVRAKTGTLTGVSSLAGVVTTKDGTTLAFAVFTDELTAWAEPALDAVAAQLSTCGCR